MSSQGATGNYHCSHSESSGFDRTCNTSFEHWPSRADFIDEAAAVGITHLATFTDGATTTYEYDGQKRLQRIVTAGALYATCDAWDNLGRCTHEVMAGICAGSESTFTYGARTVTYDTIGVPCAGRNITTFDGDGIMVSWVYSTGTNTYTTNTYTTTGRATVCR